MSGAGWREALWRMRRPPGAGVGGPEGRALRRYAFLVPFANLAGAVDVFVFLVYVLPPTFPAVSNVAHLCLLNLIAFAIFMPLSLVAGGFLTTLISLPTAHWLEGRRELGDREREMVLHQPRRQVKVSAALWLAGAITFGVLNGIYSAGLGALVAGTIALGGATTCAIVYLVTERQLRPITAKALSSGPPARPATPGVTARLLMAWGFTTAVPVLGAIVLAATLLSGASMSTSRIALTVLFLGLATITAGLLAIAVAAKS